MPDAAALLAALVLLAAIPVGAQPAVDRFHQLLAEEWEHTLREHPQFATYVGDHRFNHRLGSVTEADQARRAEIERGFLARLLAIEGEQLPPQDRISRDLLRRKLEDGLAEFEHRSHLTPITNREGFHIAFARLPERVPLATVRDYENYIARLRAFADYSRQHIGLLRRGLELGYTLPRVVLAGYEETIRPHVVDDPTASLLYAPFAKPPVHLSEADRERLRQAGRQAIVESVVPGYREFLEFMVGEYLPGCRETVGASDLPGGRAFYQHRVRSYTTLEVTPQEVHAIGLEEVARIRREMAEVMAQTGFEGSFQEFLALLRTDPRFYAASPEQLLKEASWIAKRMDGELPRLFRRLPRIPYGLEPIPDYIAPKTTGAYYTQPTGDGTRAGTYFLNTYDLASRPLYVLEALTFHEAVPGHHLQLALQQELSDLPPFRRFYEATAFVEGWALYAERLGLEAGFYQDPYSNFGRLTYEMWRACRLVVDTGLHALAWSRQQAIDYLAERTALSLHEVTTEVDRYIAWPGQALAYKMGELKIRELRRRAEAALGDRFDLRGFHDVVLRNGALPLAVLEQEVAAWLAGGAP